MRIQNIAPLAVAAAAILATTVNAQDEPSGKVLAWMRFEDGPEQYAGKAYRWLGDGRIDLTVDVKPATDHALCLLWGSKNDTRTAQVVVNGESQSVEGGGYDGFRWMKVTLPENLEGDDYQISIRQADGKAAFLAELRLVAPAGEGDQAEATGAASHKMERLAPAPGPSLASLPDDPLERSAEIAGYSLSKVQRWLHEVALKKIDPDTNLFISHHSGSARYRESLWNYDDAAADTYPFLFWAAWYTDRDQIDGPVLDVLEAEQRICNYLDRIPTAVDHKTLKKNIKSKDNLIFAASEYCKDGLVAIIEVSGQNTPWFERMRGIQDDICKHADIETPYGKIATKNVEANGEQLQVLTRLFTMTGERKYLEQAERLADYYLLQGDFVPERLRDHGCEIIGGLGLLLGVESVHNPEKAKVYQGHIRKMLDEILARGTNEDGLMYNQLGAKRGLSDGWGYNYVGFLCYDMAAGQPVYRDRVEQTLRNLGKEKYRNGWGNGQGGNIDEVADSVEGAIYLLNHIPVPEGLAWVDREMANNVTRAADPLATAKLWSTYKLDANGVRTVLQHAMMHTCGTIARPWRQDMKLGARPTADGLAVVLSAGENYTGKLEFDIPRHRHYMGFKRDWPRINAMPEWYTVEPDATQYTVENSTDGSSRTVTGAELHAGLPVTVVPGKPLKLTVTKVEQ